MRVFLFLVGLVVSSMGVQESLIITVGYCPTAFTGAGATVKVDPRTGAFEILGRFTWPQDIAAGCVVLNDPRFTFDGQKTVYLEFDAAIGAPVVELDLLEAKIKKVSTASDPFFIGFDNSFFHKGSLFKGDTLTGLQGTVTMDGYCSDGCYELGVLDLKSNGKYTNITNIPVKGVMDDTNWYDSESDTYYVQLSHDLREHQRCDGELCLFALDVKTGAILSSSPSNWTAYHYGNSGSANSVLGWVEGFAAICQHPFNDFAFANVDLKHNTAELLTCLNQNITVQMDEWVSAFSADNSLFVTASGDAFAGQAQLLTVDVKTGDALLNTLLPKLGEALGSYLKLYDIWDVQFVSHSSK